jgi:serine O-acetyltransferase
MWPRLTRDFDRMREIKGFGTAQTLVDAILLDNGFQALIAYRCGNTLRRWGVPFLPALCRRLSIAFCGIDILPQAEIDGGCYIPHGVGLVVGGATVIGEDCTLLQGVTLGEARFDSDACPKVGNRVTMGAGAKILGGITVGDDSFIGAGAVVLEDVPPQHIAIGVPARIKPVR